MTSRSSSGFLRRFFSLSETIGILPISHSSRPPLICLLILGGPCFHAGAFQKEGRIYTTNGSQADVNAAIVAAARGDTVTIPPGTYSWGTSGVGTVIDKAITLAGSGQGVTIISQTAGSGAALFYVSVGTVQGFTVNQYVGKTLFQASGGDRWRFTDIEVKGTSGRIFNVNNAYGLIDHCNITWSSESIFIVGKPDAWITSSTLGTDQAVYIEDCVFNGTTGQGYTDGHSNAKVVYRFNTCNSNSKWDAHGIWSNSPGNSSRQFEAYFNTWTSVGTGGAWPTMEWRGGTGLAFFNAGMDNTNIVRGHTRIQEYAVTSTGGYFGRYMGPDDYPIFQQLGRGKDQLPEPVYLFGNTRKAPYGQPGAVMMPFLNPTIPQASIDAYRVRSGDPNATFTHEDIVKRDRDYFTDVPAGTASLSSQPISFDGTSGVGIGPKASMMAITPTLKGVGFWVTDEGSWNTTKPENSSGRLYVWDGKSWVLYYTPFVYPHPLTKANVPPKAPENLRIR